MDLQRHEAVNFRALTHQPLCDSKDHSRIGDVRTRVAWWPLLTRPAGDSTQRFDTCLVDDGECSSKINCHIPTKDGRRWTMHWVPVCMSGPWLDRRQLLDRSKPSLVPRRGFEWIRWRGAVGAVSMHVLLALLLLIFTLTYHTGPQ